MMESEEAIMENENNCNLESESINRGRSEGALQDVVFNSRISSSLEVNDLNLQPQPENKREQCLPSMQEDTESVDLPQNVESIIEDNASVSASALPESSRADTGSDAASNFPSGYLENALPDGHISDVSSPQSRNVAQDDLEQPMEVSDKIDRNDSMQEVSDKKCSSPNVDVSQPCLTDSAMSSVSTAVEKTDESNARMPDAQNMISVGAIPNTTSETSTPDSSSFGTEKTVSFIPQADSGELLKDDSMQYDEDDVDLVEDEQVDYQTTESIISETDSKEDVHANTIQDHKESVEISQTVETTIALQTKCSGPPTSNDNDYPPTSENSKGESQSEPQTMEVEYSEDVDVLPPITEAGDAKSSLILGLPDTSDREEELDPLNISNQGEGREALSSITEVNMDTAADDDEDNVSPDKSKGQDQCVDQRSDVQNANSCNSNVDREETLAYDTVKDIYNCDVENGSQMVSVTAESDSLPIKNFESENNVNFSSEENEIASSHSLAGNTDSNVEFPKSQGNLDSIERVTEDMEVLQETPGNSVNHMKEQTYETAQTIQNEMDTGTPDGSSVVANRLEETDTVTTLIDIHETPDASSKMSDERETKSLTSNLNERLVKGTNILTGASGEAADRVIESREKEANDETVSETIYNAVSNKVENESSENAETTNTGDVSSKNAPHEHPVKDCLSNEASIETTNETNGERNSETSKEATNETSKETTNETGKETNNETSKETNNETNKKATKETNKEITNETSIETTNETDKETNNETSKETTNETSKEATNETSKETSNETNIETNNETRVETNNDTSKETNNDTSKETNNETSMETNNETSKETNNETSKETNNETSVEMNNEIGTKENNVTGATLIEARNIKQELMPDDTAAKVTPDVEVLRSIKREVGESSKNDGGHEDDDVVVLDDEGESFPVKKEPGTQDSSLVISSVSGQEHKLHEQAANAENTPNKPAAESGKGSSTKKSKAKIQTCIVCLKVCRCKYNIVRNGDIKHLCGDDCFKRFRKTPSAFLKNREGKPNEPPKADTNTISKPQGLPNFLSKFKTCSVCQLMNINPSQPFCNWKGLDFCGESCLGKFQANLSAICSYCRTFIPTDLRATYCLKIGNDVRPFCKQRCMKEFNKNLKLCACCQKDLSSFPSSFSAMVGSLDKKIRPFCSQACRQKLETQLVGVEVISNLAETAPNNSSSSQASPSVPPTEMAVCSVCQKMQAVKHTVRYYGKVQPLCSNLCLSAFQYTNNIGMYKCDSCETICTAEEAQAHFVQFEGQIKRFCSDACVNVFQQNNNKMVSCWWCRTKKMNFDMIERLDSENKFQMFCSLNCLSLYRVNLQAKSNQAVPCDQCKAVTPAQYHLTMSDASVRNFCSYNCVMTFQSQFASKPLPPTPSMLSQPVTAPPKQQITLPIQPKEPVQPVSKGRGRMSTRNAAKQQSPSFPVISNVVSLAPPPDQKQDQAPPASPMTSSEPATKNLGPDALSSGDGKHQILIKAPPVKVSKNKSLQCRPVTLTKATSCRPHSQTKEMQTEKIPEKQVLVPIPVPIYIPMPAAMYSAPTPVPVPFPVPIPVPVFIPTTRKSAAGIMKTITDIVERMPADPLEAELLMMAEAVASDKKDSESESEPEADYGPGFDDEGEEPVPAVQRANEAVNTKKKDSQGEEDMIQMALRMAEEMSAPIEDLESSVEPVAVNTDPPNNVHTTPTPVYQADEDYVPPGSRGRGRGVKRATKTRTPGRPKRQRVEKSYAEEDNSQRQTTTPQTVTPQVMKPAADANYRLKFTYGVNAWRHWVLAKNSQIENSKTNSSYRVRTFPTDILKCTTDELNFSLIFFIKEVRKSNGEEYSPDSIYYLCLGIQQYLYENGRIDSIFTDNYFEKFADSLHEILKNLQPKVNAQGQMLCRIEEEHLWESKQLGAHSPFVLLNTLIYFHTKHFILKTAQEHMSLSFAQILKHWKKGVPLKGQASSSKNISLRFYCLANGKKDNLAARKSKEGVPVYEITENFENPLRCPVKLYEFFLSKCPESIKNRNDIFYPVPERSCVPDSPVWYSTQSIGLHTMDKMLTRVLLVREIQESHLHAQPIYL